ncbi:tRNA pseudouridine(55) synthase TruB [[Mycoplasma] falconis]|uniref:tRNA pseudouridine synthase B n=1 Tax=[Mycoplasma] falconis TaxID=92403 RepID=A0A501X9B0_9BACT|nr:tRNA pseudouridine(55) synthase TruB [[Mycoplasma] falconis]TPE57158.1 tRNA pseudouridine(55) synthase TruB [[Mycoplasma] falconis]
MFYKLNKPRGISSFQMIKKFAKENNIKKIGHGGTLDPLAEGLLIVATDEDTKTLGFLLADDKSYYVKASLHQSSASFDEGEKITYLNRPKITKEQLVEGLKYIKNTKEQIPPIFSAKKVNGVRSYQLARNNKEVNLHPAKIEIMELELLDFDYNNQTFIINTKVSKGTYIRSLIHDIGLYLKTDAVVNILRRTKVGLIRLNDDLNFEEIHNINDLFPVSLVRLSKGELDLLAKSREVFIKELQNSCGFTMFTYCNQIIGWGENDFGLVKFTKIIFTRLDKFIQGRKSND